MPTKKCYMSVSIARQWFSRRSVDDGITLLWEPFVTPFLRCNIWHIKGRDRDILIDTGMGICSLRNAALDLFQKDLLAVATHTHYDHIGGFHEFEHCAVHRNEAHRMLRPEAATLLRSEVPDDELSSLEVAGYVLEEEFILARPHQHYDIASFQIMPSKPGWLLDDGDIIDTGDRHFKVMHLPGHSSGSIGLWEEATGILFSGDAIYDGPLLYDLPGSNIDDYIKTMEDLLQLDVRIVHGGHEKSFDRSRLSEIAKKYLESWRDSGAQ